MSSPVRAIVSMTGIILVFLAASVRKGDRR